MATRRYSLTVTGMHCAACAETVANSLRSVPGVKKVSVNFATERALVEVDETVNFHDLAGAVANAGYHLAEQKVIVRLDKSLLDTDRKALASLPGVLNIEPLETDLMKVCLLEGVIGVGELQRWLTERGYEVQGEERRPEKATAEEAFGAWQRAWVGLGFALIIMALNMIPFLRQTPWAPWISFTLATFIVPWVGMPFFRRAWSALRNRTANMDTLVSLGALSAYGYSLWPLLSGQGHLYFDTAAFILSAISLGKGLEARARSLATASLRRLASLLPRQVTVIRDGREETVLLEQIRPGDLVLIRAGERVPVDGLIIGGKGSLDESLLTGESEPVVKGVGEEVLGGSLCVDGFLRVEALRVGETTFLSRVARLMEEAQATKPRIQRLADRVAAVFVPIVLTLALLTFLSWALFRGDVTGAFVAAVAVTVIACPCAMGLATPTAIAVALGKLAQEGILVRDAEAMEKAGAITAVVLDKTGTVTEGQMRVAAVWSPKLPEKELLRLAASAEKGSLHPIAQALIQAASEHNLSLLDPEEVHTEVGIGVRARVKGKEIFVGKVEGEKSFDGAPIEAWRSEGFSVAGIWEDREPLGCIAFTDALRPDALQSVKTLKEMGIKVFLATGDRDEAARRVLKALGCDGVLAQATPQRKARFVRDLQGRGHKVLMVGDGINDAVALAQADIGIALASGTALTSEAADILLVTDRLTALPKLLQLAKRTKRIMRQNLFWAFAYNMAALPLAALGKLNPMVAAAAMALSSVTVVANALRLHRG